MGIWIEFRCENREEPSAKGGHSPGTRCDSHDNHGPMEMAGDTHAMVIDTLRYMEKHAHLDGWVKTRKGWFCPYCAKALGLTPNSVVDGNE